MNPSLLFRPAYEPLPPSLRSDQLPTGDARFLLFREGELLVKANASGVILCKTWPRKYECAAVHLVGHINDTPCYAAGLPPRGPGVTAHQGPPGHAFRDLRGLFGLLTEEEYACAVTAAEIIHWDENHRACGRCGGALTRAPERWLKRCPPCGREVEPTLQPSAMILLHDGPRVLLVQPQGLPAEVYTLPVTLVGAGESLELAMQRYLLRTLALEVGQFHYQESQPWPYPDRLMIGFTAAIKSGGSSKVEVQAAELRGARWFHVDDLPQLPPHISLARRLIEWYAQLPRHSGAPSIPRRAT